MVHIWENLEHILLYSIVYFPRHKLHVIPKIKMCGNEIWNEIISGNSRFTDLNRKIMYVNYHSTQTWYIYNNVFPGSVESFLDDFLLQSERKLSQVLLGLFVYVISGFFALRYVIVSHLFDDVMPTAETWDSIHDSYEFASP